MSLIKARQWSLDPVLEWTNDTNNNADFMGFSEIKKQQMEFQKELQEKQYKILLKLLNPMLNSTKNRRDDSTYARMMKDCFNNVVELVGAENAINEQKLSELIKGSGAAKDAFVSMVYNLLANDINQLKQNSTAHDADIILLNDTYDGVTVSKDKLEAKKQLIDDILKIDDGGGILTDVDSEQVGRLKDRMLYWKRVEECLISPTAHRSDEKLLQTLIYRAVEEYSSSDNAEKFIVKMLKDANLSSDLSKNLQTVIREQFEAAQKKQPKFHKKFTEEAFLTDELTDLVNLITKESYDTINIDNANSDYNFKTTAKLCLQTLEQNGIHKLFDGTINALLNIADKLDESRIELDLGRLPKFKEFLETFKEAKKDLHSLNNEDDFDFRHLARQINNRAYFDKTYQKAFEFILKAKPLLADKAKQLEDIRLKKKKELSKKIDNLVQKIIAQDKDSDAEPLSENDFIDVFGGGDVKNAQLFAESIDNFSALYDLKNTELVKVSNFIKSSIGKDITGIGFARADVEISKYIKGEACDEELVGELLKKMEFFNFTKDIKMQQGEQKEYMLYFVRALNNNNLTENNKITCYKNFYDFCKKVAEFDKQLADIEAQEETITIDEKNSLYDNLLLDEEYWEMYSGWLDRKNIFHAARFFFCSANGCDYGTWKSTNIPCDWLVESKKSLLIDVHRKERKDRVGEQVLEFTKNIEEIFKQQAQELYKMDSLKSDEQFVQAVLKDQNVTIEFLNSKELKEHIKKAATEDGGRKHGPRIGVVDDHKKYIEIIKNAKDVYLCLQELHDVYANTNIGTESKQYKYRQTCLGYFNANIEQYQQYCPEFEGKKKEELVKIAVEAKQNILNDFLQELKDKFEPIVKDIEKIKNSPAQTDVDEEGKKKVEIFKTLESLFIKYHLEDKKVYNILIERVPEEYKELIEQYNECQKFYKNLDKCCSKRHSYLNSIELLDRQKFIPEFKKYVKRRKEFLFTEPQKYWPECIRTYEEIKKDIGSLDAATLKAIVEKNDPNDYVKRAISILRAHVYTPDTDESKDDRYKTFLDDYDKLQDGPLVPCFKIQSHDLNKKELGESDNISISSHSDRGDELSSNSDLSSDRGDDFDDLGGGNGGGRILDKAKTELGGEFQVQKNGNSALEDFIGAVVTKLTIMTKVERTKFVKMVKKWPNDHEILKNITLDEKDILAYYLSLLYAQNTGKVSYDGLLEQIQKRNINLSSNIIEQSLRFINTISDIPPLTSKNFLSLLISQSTLELYDFNILYKNIDESSSALSSKSLSEDSAQAIRNSLDKMCCICYLGKKDQSVVKSFLEDANAGNKQDAIKKFCSNMHSANENLDVNGLRDDLTLVLSDISCEKLAAVLDITLDDKSKVNDDSGGQDESATAFEPANPPAKVVNPKDEGANFTFAEKSNNPLVGGKNQDDSVAETPKFGIGKGKGNFVDSRQNSFTGFNLLGNNNNYSSGNQGGGKNQYQAGSSGGGGKNQGSNNQAGSSGGGGKNQGSNNPFTSGQDNFTNLTALATQWGGPPPSNPVGNGKYQGGNNNNYSYNYGSGKQGSGGQSKFINLPAQTQAQGGPPPSNPVGNGKYQGGSSGGGGKNQGSNKGGGSGGGGKNQGSNNQGGSSGGGFHSGNGNSYNNNNAKKKDKKKDAEGKDLLSSILDAIKKENKPTKNQADQNKISEKEKELALLRKTRDDLLLKDSQSAQAARQARILNAQALEAQNRTKNNEEKEEKNTESVFLVILLTLLTGGLYLIYRLLFGDRKESNRERKLNRAPQVGQILAKNNTIEPQKAISAKPEQKNNAEYLYKKQSIEINKSIPSQEMQM